MGRPIFYRVTAAGAGAKHLYRRAARTAPRGPLGGLSRQAGSAAAPLATAAIINSTGARRIIGRHHTYNGAAGSTAADVRYLKNGCAAALRQLRDRLTAAEQGAVATLPVGGAAPALRALQCRYRIVSGFRGSVGLAVRTLGERSQSAAQLLMVWHPVSGP